jgi:hypothetical protein
MRKICSFHATYLAYNVPVVRQANVYESDADEFKGRPFEVSVHNGNPVSEWEFKPFSTLVEAQVYALKFLCPNFENND